MANKPLKSVQFPGLTDTYTIPQIDTTLAVAGKAADAKAVGDAIDAIEADIPAVDATLATAGAAADAKATGDEISGVKSAITNIETATANDVNKALSPKTVTNGKVTEWQYKVIGGGGGGAVDDVQINGTSIVDGEGVANIPIASTDNAGVVKTNINNGVGISGGSLYIFQSYNETIKAGTLGYRPICPQYQHQAVFYGLAKAAGADEKDSTLALGTYTENAKSAIQHMLGVEQGVAFVEDVSGTVVSITGQANTRYMCGEVSTIAVAPPNLGTIDVFFKSGSTPAVLTVTPPTGKTMKWANGFDPDSLDADTTYELIITDGEYGGVTAWAD